MIAPAFFVPTGIVLGVLLLACVEFVRRDRKEHRLMWEQYDQAVAHAESWNRDVYPVLQKRWRDAGSRGPRPAPLPGPPRPIGRRPR